MLVRHNKLVGKISLIGIFIIPFIVLCDNSIFKTIESYKNNNDYMADGIEKYEDGDSDIFNIVKDDKNPDPQNYYENYSSLENHDLFLDNQTKLEVHDLMKIAVNVSKKKMGLHQEQFIHQLKNNSINFTIDTRGNLCYQEKILSILKPEINDCVTMLFCNINHRDNISHKWIMKEKELTNLEQLLKSENKKKSLSLFYEINKYKPHPSYLQLSLSSREKLEIKQTLYEENEPYKKFVFKIDGKDEGDIEEKLNKIIGRPIYIFDLKKTMERIREERNNYDKDQGIIQGIYGLYLKNNLKMDHNQQYHVLKECLNLYNKKELVRDQKFFCHTVVTNSNSNSIVEINKKILFSTHIIKYVNFYDMCIVQNREDYYLEF